MGACLRGVVRRRVGGLSGSSGMGYLLRSGWEQTSWMAIGFFSSPSLELVFAGMCREIS